MKNGREMAIVAASLWALAGCDREPSKLDRIVEASVAPAASAVPFKPQPSVPPIAVDDRGAFVDGDRVEFEGTPFEPRIAAEIAGKPMVRGEAIVIDATRETKTSRVVDVVLAVAKSGAKTIAVRSKGRDGIAATLAITTPVTARSECSVVASIARDGAISVWHVGGGTATRFSRGFAGPDLTLGSEAIRKAAASCDSPLLYIGTDDAITWGLAFDLARAAHADSDAGTMRATGTVLVASPIPGRKVLDPI